MKILITGGCGFIGHHLSNELSKLGNEVIVWDNLSTGKSERLNSGIKLNILDVLEDDLPNFKVDYIYHLASPTSVQESIENPEKYERGCFEMTKKIFEWGIKNGCKKFIFSSTSAIFGDCEELPIKEESKTNPMSPYAKFKLESEYYLLNRKKELDIDVIIFRFFNVFGEEQPLTGSYTPAVARFLEQYKNDLEITVTGDGLQTRDYIYVKDLSEALIRVLKNIQGICIFNLGSGVEYKILDIAKHLNGRIKFIEKRHEPRRTRSDISLISKKLNWNPMVSVYDWLDEQIKIKLKI
jgi:nucleoside-diphosphate-sugar epimerase